MRGAEEALLIAVAVVILAVFILIGVSFLQSKEPPKRPEIPKTEPVQTCASDNDCRSSADGPRCVQIQTAGGAQRFCGCLSNDDCIEASCGSGNKCASGALPVP